MNETTKFSESLNEHSTKARSLEYLNEFIENHGLKQVFLGHRPDAIVQLYHNCLKQLIGENSSVTYGAGKWLELMQGKPLFEILFKQFYRSRAAHPNDQYRELSRDLLKSSDSIPADLIEIKRMILKAAGIAQRHL